MSLPVHLSIVGVALGTSHVRKLHFSHELSRPWRLHLEVGSTDPDIDLDRMIGAEARLDLPGEPLMPTIVGVVESAAQSAVEASGESTYLFEVAPRVALLAHRRSQRIFQHQDVIATVAQLLGEHTLPPPVPLQVEAHADREYTVQWKESDLDFALRLLAEDGMTLIMDPAHERISLVDDTRTRTSCCP